MLKRQEGMTFIGFIFVAVIALSLLLAGVKIVPDYIEFSGVKKTIQNIGEDPNFDSMSKQEIMKSFDKRASINYVSVINGRDLIFTRDASGKKVVTAEYEVVKPLAFNLSALMDFRASTEK
ncbi:MAG: DUF4845 domain-containing protein [Methylophilaceae bacterium]